MRKTFKGLLAGAIVSGLLSGTFAKADDKAAPAKEGETPKAEAKNECSNGGCGEMKKGADAKNAKTDEHHKKGHPKKKKTDQ